MKNITIRNFSDTSNLGICLIYDITTIVLVPTMSISTEKTCTYRTFSITFAFLPIRFGFIKRFKIMKRFKTKQGNYVIKGFVYNEN